MSWRNVSSKFPQGKNLVLLMYTFRSVSPSLPPSSVFIKMRITQVRDRIYKMQRRKQGPRFALPFNRKPRTRSVTSPGSSYLLASYGAVLRPVRDGSHIKLVIHVIVIAYIPDGTVIVANVRAPFVWTSAYFIINEQQRETCKLSLYTMHTCMLCVSMYVRLINLKFRNLYISDQKYPNL